MPNTDLARCYWELGKNAVRDFSAHYDQWRANFGAMASGSGSSVSNASSIAEPATFALLLLAWLLHWANGRKCAE
jgi:hypothetical protein